MTKKNPSCWGARVHLKALAWLGRLSLSYSRVDWLRALELATANEIMKHLLFAHIDGATWHVYQRSSDVKNYAYNEGSKDMKIRLSSSKISRYQFCSLADGLQESHRKASSAFVGYLKPSDYAVYCLCLNLINRVEVTIIEWIPTDNLPCTARRDCTQHGRECLQDCRSYWRSPFYSAHVLTRTRLSRCFSEQFDLSLNVSKYPSWQIRKQGTLASLVRPSEIAYIMQA